MELKGSMLARAAPHPEKAGAACTAAAAAAAAGIKRACAVPLAAVIKADLTVVWTAAFDVCFSSQRLNRTELLSVLSKKILRQH
eukprot:6209702-Pleurochrysis_carterae.AAC.5